MRNRFDQLAKQIGKEALGRSGTTVVHDEISPETQHADLRHEPDPARESERGRLGLLGRLAAVLCLIEIYGHAPSGEEFRACLSKHFAFWQQRARKARARTKGERRQSYALVEPFLWIVAAGAPTAIVAKLKLEPACGWPAGVYFFGDDVLRVGLVVASELPRDRSTLLVRLMAAGPLLRPAIEDLSLLPPDAHERVVAEQILLNLQHALGRKPTRTQEEQEFIVTMHNTWEKAREQGWEQGRKQGWEQGRKQGWEQGQKQGWEQGQKQGWEQGQKQGWEQGQKQGWEQGQKQGWEQGREEGREQGQKQGRDEGRAEEAARAVLTVLRARGVEVPDAIRDRILSQKDWKVLEQWLERAAVAASAAEAINHPS